MASIDWDIEVFDTLSSTQDHLKELVGCAAEGRVIHALSQSDGHGRHGRVWNSPCGNLYVSYLLKPTCKATEIGQLSLLVGLALHQVIAVFTDDPVMLKWPNDVLLGGDRRKCAGILLDCDLAGADVESCVVGIGVNIASAPEYGAAIGGDILPSDFLLSYLEVFDGLYASWLTDGFAGCRQQWLGCAHARGTALQVKIGKQLVRGEFYDIDAQGNARITDEGGVLRVVSSGDVFLNEASL